MRFGFNSGRSSSDDASMLADWLNALVAQLLGGYIKRECLEKADYNFCESYHFVLYPLTGNSKNSTTSALFSGGHYVILKGLELKPEVTASALCSFERAISPPDQTALSAGSV